MIDLYDFMVEVSELYEQCGSKEEIDGLAIKLTEYIQSQGTLSKQYLELGIL